MKNVNILIKVNNNSPINTYPKTKFIQLIIINAEFETVNNIKPNYINQ